MADDDVVRLSDYQRVPPIGDPVYGRVYNVKPGDVRELRSPRAHEVIDSAVKEGIALDLLAKAIDERQQTCAHQHTVIDSKRRTLRCDDCGAAVDPFDLLYRISGHNDRLYRSIVNRDRLEKNVSILRKNLEQLQAEEKRVKSRAASAKRAREKALRLGDQELYELSLFRDLYDAGLERDVATMKRLRGILETMQTRRREAEQAEREPPSIAPVGIARRAPDG